MRILLLSQRVPYPPNRGDKITTYHLVRHLAARHDLSVLALEDGAEDAANARALASLGVAEVFTAPLRPLAARLRAARALLGRDPFTLPYFRSPALARAVEERVARGLDLFYAYSSSMAPYALGADGCARVLHFGELDSDKWTQYAERSPPPARWLYAREARRLLAFEREAAAGADLCVVCTETERELFLHRIGPSPVEVLPNGVDLDRFSPGSPDGKDPASIVFTGVMNYPPNVEAVRTFATRAMPRLRAKVPAVRFWIVGARPTRAVRRLHDGESVLVTGAVPETTPYLRRAAVAVAPLRVARGIQNKVLEAMACALPVVATPAAARGIEAQDGVHFFVESGEDAFVARVAELLRDRKLRAAIGRAARAFVEERHRWEDVYARFDGLLSRAMENGRARMSVSSRKTP